MATGRPDLILQYGDRAYSIWKHRPPIGSDRALRLRYSQAIESDIQKIVALAVEARTAGSGPISVSPFVSACIVEASALAADSTHTRQLDLENLHPQRAVENTLFTVIQDYQYTDIQGWWSQREGLAEMDARSPIAHSHPVAQIPMPPFTISALPAPPAVPAPATVPSPSGSVSGGQAARLPPAMLPKDRVDRFARQSGAENGPMPCAQASHPPTRMPVAPAALSSAVPLTKVGPPRHINFKKTIPINAAASASKHTAPSVPGPPVMVHEESHQRHIAAPLTPSANTAPPNPGKKVPPPVQTITRSSRKRTPVVEEEREKGEAEKADRSKEKVGATQPPAKRRRTQNSTAALNTISSAGQKSSPAIVVHSPSPRRPSSQDKGKQKAKQVQIKKVVSRAPVAEEIEDSESPVHDHLGRVQGGQSTVIEPEPRAKSHLDDDDVSLAVLFKSNKAERAMPANQAYIRIPPRMKTAPPFSRLLATVPGQSPEPREVPGQSPEPREVPGQSPEPREVPGQSPEADEVPGPNGQFPVPISGSGMASSMPDLLTSTSFGPHNYSSVSCNANQALFPISAAPLGSIAPDILQGSWSSHVLTPPGEHQPLRPNFDHSTIVHTINHNFSQSRIQAGQLWDAMSQVGRRGTSVESRVVELEAEVGALRSQVDNLRASLSSQNALQEAQNEEILHLRQRIGCLRAYFLERPAVVAGSKPGQSAEDVGVSVGQPLHGAVAGQDASIPPSPRAVRHRICQNSSG